MKVDVSDVDVALRLLAATGLGGAIGLERELSDQPAGLRTHITVALGAALFGVMSVHGFDAYVQLRADSNYQIDVTRVASQVVVGVGFLGAGAILKEGLSIRGLTTAASPVGVEELSSWAVDAFVHVRAEVVALGLEQVGG